jgi:hypothetical protein
MKEITRDEMSELLTNSRIKRRLREELRFVPEAVANWEDRDFLVVTNKSGSEGVLIISPAPFRIVPFGLQKRTANNTGRIEAVICDICATWQRGSNSAVITFAKSTPSVSFLVCADLACSLHVRGKTVQSKLSRVQLRENMIPDARIKRLKLRLSRIVKAL